MQSFELEGRSTFNTETETTNSNMFLTRQNAVKRI